MTGGRLLGLLGALLLLVSIPGACTRRTSPPTEATPRALVGAGATLPYPLYSKWAAEYSRIDPTVRINYQSIGSGAGVRQVEDGVVDFGATDEPLRAPPARMVLVPTTVGAVVVVFNVSGHRELALTPELVADIFLGKLTRWDDERLRSVNPGRELPGGSMVVVHRADGSGTSAALTTYLAERSEAWRTTVGAGTSPRFPVGVGAKGNEGVAALVKSTPLSIGYVELAYAKQSDLAMAQMRNRAGNFVAPSLDALDRAARSVSSTTDVSSASLVESADERAYPIAALSFVVVPQDATDRLKAEALAKFLWWAIHDGQAHASPLEYAPLPPLLVARGERALRELRADGRPLLPGSG